MTALQSIIKEAKAIRKKSPKIEWKKAVAQASAIYASKHKGKSPVGKKKAVKKAAKKKAVGSVKKKAAKKVARKKATKKVGVVKKATTMHKDTKSHNVKISVMSGVNDKILQDLKQINERENYFNNQLIRLKQDYAALKTQKNSRGHIIANKRYEQQVKSILRTIKKEKANLKKHIK
jgi:hypothetical protein